ncbi:unnamed protein product [Cladocopium goreaui]|uniref:Retrovirus-related Pol polyprotein from transposon TNT 1-94 n=1 Tax=Cladocopium goreaui TaxID=2562237 RepID=A0A9P1D4B7_9DINO|nr:unnamed protein product [Cladocopium goreaui]CAI4002342.1 unnamed protein product [Cladocopium goreaui]
MDSLATGGCFFNAVFLFTWLLGLIGYIYLAIRPGELLKNFDFVSDAETSSTGAVEDPIDNSSNSDASDHPAWSEEGMVHWLYDRCERRLQKAVTKQDPTKTNQYLARQGILSDMLAALEVATAETRGHIQQVLEDITDLSSDEDSPTMNTGGHDIALNSGVPTGIATAFVHGVAGMSLCGCDIGDIEISNNSSVIPFTTLVLTAWSWHLVVNEDLQLEGSLLVALRRINGRLERAQRRGNIGQGMKHMQNRTWLLSCVAHYASCSPQADKAFRAIMTLPEYDQFEEVTKLIGQLGGALREVKPESSKSDEEMAEETPAEKTQRYMNCGQSEASDPDLWADVHYGPRNRRDDTEPGDGTGLQVVIDSGADGSVLPNVEPPDELPAAAEEAELPVAERPDVDYKSVMVDGVKLDSNTPLRTLRGDTVGDETMEVTAEVHLWEMRLWEQRRQLLSTLEMVEMSQKDLDALESYDFDLDETDDSSHTDAELLEQLNMGVLIPANEFDFKGETPKMLTTRRHMLLSERELAIQSHPKHLEKLFEMMKINKGLKPKQVPVHQLLDEPEETEELPPDKTKTFRSCIGILLYIASDFVECQYAIRGLAQVMSKPTVQAFICLRHLCLYLLGCVDQCTVMTYSDHQGLLHYTPTEYTMEVYSDSVEFTLNLDNSAAKAFFFRSGNQETDESESVGENDEEEMIETDAEVEDQPTGHSEASLHQQMAETNALLLAREQRLEAEWDEAELRNDRETMHEIENMIIETRNLRYSI